MLARLLLLTVIAAAVTAVPLAPEDSWSAYDNSTTCPEVMPGACLVGTTPYKNLAAANPDACCAACQADASCAAWNFNTDPAAAPPCHLKKTPGNGTSPGPNCTSGLVRGPPAPASLPDIPKQLWIGFWGGTPKSYSCSTAYGDDQSGQVKDSQIEQHGGPSMRFLYPAYNLFCKEQDMTDKCTLFDDYEDRWKKAIPKLTKWLAEKKIVGLHVGDERICDNDRHGTSIDDWHTVINTMRKTFPRGKAIIYANECSGTFGPNNDCDQGIPGGGRRRKSQVTNTTVGDDPSIAIPDGLDWIGIDNYRNHHDSGPGWIPKCMQPYYEKYIFPKMADHQKAAITPQMTCLKDGDDLEPWANSWKDCFSTLKQDGKDAVNWAQNEDRIGYIVPYRWDEAEQKCPDGSCDDLMSFWHDYGQSLKP